MKLEFHVHTISSYDSTNNIDKLLQIESKNNVDAVIICDHNSIDGALMLASKSKKLKVIAGEEITTQSGEIIGIFLKHMIAPMQSLENTIKEIKRQGGLVCIPHPCDRLRSKVLKIEIDSPLWFDIDLIEVFNARTVFNVDNLKAASLCNEKKKQLIYGSDAHNLGELSRTTMSLKEFSTPNEFLDALSDAQAITVKAPVLVHLITFIRKRLSQLGVK